MEALVRCEIVSAERSIFSDGVRMVVVSCTQGDVGILPGHAPLLCQLDPGPVRVIDRNSEEILFHVSSGFLEVQPNIVTILADEITRAEDVDEAAAQEAIEEAKRDFANQRAEIDYAAVIETISHYSAQLRTLRKLRKKYARRPY
jgi:F-type H+-transporting ATPase subunit epsilon